MIPKHGKCCRVAIIRGHLHTSGVVCPSIAAVVPELLEVAGRTTVARKHHRSLGKGLRRGILPFIRLLKLDVRRVDHLFMAGRMQDHS